MQIRTKTTIGIIAIGVIITIGGVLSKNKFVHIDEMPKSNIHVVILSGHGSIQDGKYQTQGKQSPTWQDGLKIYEGYSCKLLALDLSKKLTENHIDNTIINNYSTDLSLIDRANKINELFNINKKIVGISLHHNAQPVDKADYTDFEGLKGFTSTSTGGATGIEVFTSVGKTESDNIADNYILPAMKRNMPNLHFRNNGKAKEQNFYILSKTKSPHILIEWMFMTTYTDCLIIADDYYRETYINSIVEGYIQYNNSISNK